ncbi:MAG: hypothetical protein CM1200mP10_12520 [Candidatus Neomarinimicrobiota bacterium]|nr:MAG: hypothetical protein CM1200mP10_12520 [Candidatus Neomarinimicrobiota bacterium]
MELIDKRKYLQPEMVARLSNMSLRARLVVEGYIIGQHKSPFHGFSVGNFLNIVRTVLVMKYAMLIGNYLRKQIGIM